MRRDVHPAAGPPSGFLTLSAVSGKPVLETNDRAPLARCTTDAWRSRAARAPSREHASTIPGTFPVQSLPLAHSTFTPLGAAASLVVGDRRSWCDERAVNPPGFPDARDLRPALMGAGLARWPGSPLGSCDRFSAASRPRLLGALGSVRRAHPALASSLDLGALLRARIRSAPRRFPSA